VPLAALLRLGSFAPLPRAVIGRAIDLGAIGAGLAALLRLDPRLHARAHRVAQPDFLRQRHSG
jgi:hypothetical protein